MQLDGYAPIPWRWGAASLPVSPGRHRVRCWFRWGLFTTAGEGVIDVDVPDGGVVRVRYMAPTWFVFNKGRITLDGGLALGAPPAGWHPDPSGRYAARYWDGAAWTRHVSTNGVASMDEMG